MIEPAYLNELAEHTSAKVTKIVLNGTYEIEQLRVKTVSGGMLSLEYLVPFGSVDAVQTIEVEDSLHNKVSTNQVYVPITSDTIMRQTITIKEG
ncbi:ketopantoate hydroxymethyltransferase [Paenibacillus sp. FJAT-26967]|uniref:ketopantoate hydroxymethyltransferase n=1 Tax=Paenibacillus sp. FJAT-26967 TaxID=1729690 RepID=UPI000839746D|nr:ketopantoate hydroxymethyltransferase [Paenibacillus sp. FJAT-26967]